MTAIRPLEIATLSSSAADDSLVMTSLTRLINDVYAGAQEGLWLDGSVRTTVEEVTKLTRSGQLAVARRGAGLAEIVGCVRVQFLADHVAEFGMLAVLERDRGTGTGRELVRFAERAARRQRCHTMQLEVLVPREWSHPSKDFIIAWYTRLGYRRTRIIAIEESYPQLAPLLATPCDFVVYRRHLESAPSVTT